jgi:hypothetical protein
VTAPSPKRDGNDAPNAGIERDERREALLGHPIDGGSGALFAHVGDERQRVDDVSERRGPHDENRRHAPSRPGETP